MTDTLTSYLEKVRKDCEAAKIAREVYAEHRRQPHELWCDDCVLLSAVSYDSEDDARPSTSIVNAMAEVVQAADVLDKSVDSAQTGPEGLGSAWLDVQALVNLRNALARLEQRVREVEGGDGVTCTRLLTTQPNASETEREGMDGVSELSKRLRSVAADRYQARSMTVVRPLLREAADGMEALERALLAVTERRSTDPQPVPAEPRYDFENYVIHDHIGPLRGGQFCSACEVTPLDPTGESDLPAQSADVGSED